MAGVKKTYTMSDLSLEIHKKLGVPYRETSAITIIMFERIKAALGRGQTIEFRKFGRLHFDGMARLRFKPAKSLRDLLITGRENGGK